MIPWTWLKQTCSGLALLVIWLKSNKAVDPFSWQAHSGLITMAAISNSSSSPEADQLIALIASSAQTIVGAYDSAGLPPPDLNAARKTSDALMTPDTRDATRILEGACAQLCSLLAHPSHLMINNANGVRYVSAVTILTSDML